MASWFLVLRTFFQDWLLVKKIFFHQPGETRESYYISIQELFGPFWKFKLHILYFCARIVKRIRFMTPNRSCIPESTDNRPRNLCRGSLGMFLASLLYVLKCLRIDLFKIDCCLHVSFIIWFLYVLNSIKKRMQSVHRASRPHDLFLS